MTALNFILSHQYNDIAIPVTTIQKGFKSNPCERQFIDQYQYLIQPEFSKLDFVKPLAIWSVGVYVSRAVRTCIRSLIKNSSCNTD